MSSSDWQEVVGALGAFLLVAAVITVSIWQFAATWRAKSLLAREQEYKAIADKAVSAQESTERQLAEINGRLAEMQSRMQQLERILKDVD